MLALSIKKGEDIVVNNDIELTVLEIKGDQVKIGISAPRSVPVYRKEVYLQIQEENKEAVDEERKNIVKIFRESWLTIKKAGKAVDIFIDRKDFI